MRKHGVLGVAVLCGLLFSGVTWAQVSTGTISGAVKDSSGAALPAAKVVVANQDTGISRTFQTDENGHYSAVSLSPGNYRVTGTREGFQTEVRSGIVLTVGQEAIVDLSLAVGSVTQTVTVTGGAPLVETTTASLGSLVDDQTIRALPLNGRSWDQLALLQPGVILNSPGHTGGSPYAYGTSKKFTVGGQRDVSNSFLLDGTNVNDQANGTPGGAAGTNLGVDTILEFRIFTNSFKAEYGHSSGSVITAVTRSGTNAFHGTAFEYIRNSWLDARNYFDPASGPPAFRRNQFGGVLGGPIKKNKTFFFAGYEGLRQGLGTTQTAIVPTVAARQGILPSGNITVNPDIVPYLNLYPLPNGTDFGDGTAQFLSAPVVPTNEDNVMARVDHQLNAKTSLFARYMFDTDSVNAQQQLPNYSIDESTRRTYATLQAIILLSPRALNSFRFAFNRTNSAFSPTISPAAPPELDLIPGQSLGAINVGTSSLGLTFLGSQAGNSDRLYNFNIFEWGDDLSYTIGKHTLKAGVDIQRMQDNTASGQTVRGQLTFPSYTAFLLGQPSNLQATGPLGVLPKWGLRQSLFAVYVQDDYMVLSRLTLNLGLRWETATDPKDAGGKASVLPSLSAPAMVPSDKFFSIGKKNFEPRFGLSWQVTGNGKTVLRAAAGIYHNQILPWAYQLNIINPPFFGKFSADNPPFPNSYTVLQPGTTPLAITPFTPTEKTPVDYQYNLSIQQEIARSTVVQVAYAGGQARQLETERQADTYTPIFINGDPAHPFYPVGAPRLNPAFGSILQLQMNGNSSYNSLTFSLHARSSSGFQGQVSYTYAKSMDENSNVSASDSRRSVQAIMNPFYIRQDYGLSDFNVKHAAVGSFVYPLPFRATSKALGVVANGWSFNGIATFQSGMPFTAYLVGSVSRDGSIVAADRPNLNPGASNSPTSGTSVGCAGLPAGTPVGNAAHWYDPCAFSLPLAGTYGNLGRNTIIGPGLADLDLALEKSFKLSETAKATFRAEMFNVMNHTNFGLPNGSALRTNGTANGSAGLITETLTPSRQLQFALRISF
jgi:Carboxypeptidase regulatory-like domain